MFARRFWAIHRILLLLAIAVYAQEKTVSLLVHWQPTSWANLQFKDNLSKNKIYFTWFLLYCLFKLVNKAKNIFCFILQACFEWPFLLLFHTFTVNRKNDVVTLAAMSLIGLWLSSHCWNCSNMTICVTIAADICGKIQQEANLMIILTWNAGGFCCYCSPNNIWVPSGHARCTWPTGP